MIYSRSGTKVVAYVDIVVLLVAKEFLQAILDLIQGDLFTQQWSRRKPIKIIARSLHEEALMSWILDHHLNCLFNTEFNGDVLKGVDPCDLFLNPSKFSVNIVQPLL